jgi:hypothetical protein
MYTQFSTVYTTPLTIFNTNSSGHNTHSIGSFIACSTSSHPLLQLAAAVAAPVPPAVAAGAAAAAAVGVRPARVSISISGALALHTSFFSCGLSQLASSGPSGSMQTLTNPATTEGSLCANVRRALFDDNQKLNLYCG